MALAQGLLRGARHEREHVEADIVVVGGGSAGSTAAIRAQQALPRGRVILLEKAHIKRSGAIAIGMDGLNNAVIPGHATPEQYVKEITMANDGIVNQRAVWEYAVNSYSMIEELDRWGVKFQKTEAGEFDVKKVHHKGSYVLPMPEGYDLKTDPDAHDQARRRARDQPGDGDAAVARRRSSGRRARLRHARRASSR